MKINWGTGIAITLTVFVLFILSLVYGTSIANFDLVAPDYYDQEIEYQSIIDAKDRANLFETVLITNVIDKEVELHLLDDELKNATEWNIILKRPNNGVLDRQFNPNPSKEYWKSSGANLTAGRYLMQVSWQLNGKLHLLEKVCIVSS